MLVDFPILLPHKEDLIIPTHPEGMPAVLPQPAAWFISGNTPKAKKHGHDFELTLMYKTAELEDSGG